MRRLLARFGLVAALATAVTLGSAVTATAEPFTIQAVLTGDFRASNPDNIVLDVTIMGDTTSNVTSWIVDLNSPLHPDAFLGTFAFSIDGVSYSDVSFSNFSPDAWSFSIAPGTNVPGSGGADFVFESNDPAGSSNVTNSIPLTFTATLTSGTWSPTMFTDAPLATGGGIPSPGAQLGAHVRSLSTAGCAGCSDSGFASGNYASVPEPSSLSLLALGAVLLGSKVRSRRKQ
jgi:hypothetical protein